MIVRDGKTSGDWEQLELFPVPGDGHRQHADIFGPLDVPVASDDEDEDSEWSHGPWRDSDGYVR
jgi:hypothetical protein